MSVSAAIQLAGISVRFGGVTALDRVDLLVPAGAAHALIGPNGAGKSTLINVLTGVQRQFNGQVRIHGVDVSGWKPHRIPRLGLARTFQTIQVMPRASVRENVRIGAFLRSAASKVCIGSQRAPAASAVNARVRGIDLDTVIDTLALREIERRIAGELPLGQLRLVELGRALMLQPSIIVLDEPASGMTETERDAMMEVLRRVHATFGVTMLIVEHAIDFLQGICATGTVLDRGQVIAHGDLGTILNHAAVIEAYLGSAA